MSVPENREVEIGPTRMCLAAERSPYPGRKGAELARQVLAPSQLYGVEQCRRIWEPGAGKDGGQGALIQPE
jgi:hypothetical protein